MAGSPIRLSAERTYEGSVYPSSGTLATASATTGAGGRFRAALTAPPGAAIVARYRGSARYWPAYAVAAGSGAGLRNVARGRPVVASAEQTTQPAAYAVDGDATMGWGVGAFAPQWVEIDLGATFSIVAIRLGVAQTPAGDNRPRRPRKAAGRLLPRAPRLPRADDGQRTLRVRASGALGGNPLPPRRDAREPVVGRVARG